MKLEVVAWYMEVDMEDLTKKTTNLFSPDLYRRLIEVAERKGVSVGALVREACVQVYGLVDMDTRASAVDALAGMSLPVAGTAQMKRESVPDADDLLP